MKPSQYFGQHDFAEGSLLSVRWDEVAGVVDLAWFGLFSPGSVAGWGRSQHPADRLRNSTCRFERIRLIGAALVHLDGHEVTDRSAAWRSFVDQVHCHTMTIEAAELKCVNHSKANER